MFNFDETKLIMSDSKINILDKIIMKLTDYMDDAKKAFVFGGVFFGGLFYYTIHNPAINNYKSMIAATQKDIDFWRSKYEENEKKSSIKISEAEERIRKNQEECLDNLVRTNNLLQNLKTNKTSEADLSKKVADYQQKILEK